MSVTVKPNWTLVQFDGHKDPISLCQFPSIESSVDFLEKHIILLHANSPGQYSSLSTFERNVELDPDTSWDNYNSFFKIPSETTELKLINIACISSKNHPSCLFYLERNDDTQSRKTSETISFINY